MIPFQPSSTRFHRSWSQRTPIATTMVSRVVALGLALASACAPHGSPVSTAAGHPPEPSPETRNTPAPQPETFDGLPFVRNDYPTARATALEHNQPIFAEVWAKW